MTYKTTIKNSISDLIKPYKAKIHIIMLENDDICQYMQRWYWTRHNAIMEALEEKDKQISVLQNKLNQIKAVIRKTTICLEK